MFVRSFAVANSESGLDEELRFDIDRQMTLADRTAPAVRVDHLSRTRSPADGAGATGTPSGHWIDLVRQLSLRQPVSPAQSAEAVAPVRIAVADSFIGCWNAKFVHNLLRPVAYIRDNIDPAACWNE